MRTGNRRQKEENMRRKTSIPDCNEKKGGYKGRNSKQQGEVRIMNKRGKTETQNEENMQQEDKKRTKTR